jgi:hypothetical protein
MNSRRRIRHASEPLCGQLIVAGAVWERAEPCRTHGGDFAPDFCIIKNFSTISKAVRRPRPGVGGTATFLRSIVAIPVQLVALEFLVRVIRIADRRPITMVGTSV